MKKSAIKLLFILDFFVFANTKQKFLNFNFLTIFKHQNYNYYHTFITAVCEDKHSSCKVWATEYNFCEVSYVKYMRKNCCFSCHLPRNHISKQCQNIDKYSQCAPLTKIRGCKGWLLKYCKKSCHIC